MGFPVCCLYNLMFIKNLAVPRKCVACNLRMLPGQVLVLRSDFSCSAFPQIADTLPLWLFNCVQLFSFVEDTGPPWRLFIYYALCMYVLQKKHSSIKKEHASPIKAQQASSASPVKRKKVSHTRREWMCVEGGGGREKKKERERQTDRQTERSNLSLFHYAGLVLACAVDTGQEGTLLR